MLRFGDKLCRFGARNGAFCGTKQIPATGAVFPTQDQTQLLYESWRCEDPDSYAPNTMRLDVNLQTSQQSPQKFTSPHFVNIALRGAGWSVLALFGLPGSLINLAVK